MEDEFDYGGSWQRIEDAVADYEESRISPPVIAPLRTPFIDALIKLRANYQIGLAHLKPTSELEKISAVAANNHAVDKAIQLAEAEELRVRGFVESADGYCLDTEEERRQFIEALYGTGNTDNR
jgi:hypothetical protein